MRRPASLPRILILAPRDGRGGVRRKGVCCPAGCSLSLGTLLSHLEPHCLVPAQHAQQHAPPPHLQHCRLTRPLRMSQATLTLVGGAGWKPVLPEVLTLRHSVRQPPASWRRSPERSHAARVDPVSGRLATPAWWGTPGGGPSAAVGAPPPACRRRHHQQQRCRLTRPSRKSQATWPQPCDHLHMERPPLPEAVNTLVWGFQRSGR